jgi:endonuclease/exonuclease/phosphatase family metal-dependent hydrolase
MTFNLRVRMILDGSNIWDRRRDLVVERVRAFDPDLFGTQEGLDSMEMFLRQRLGDYTFVGAGRSDGKQRGEMCGVFFRTARFERVDGGHFWLSDTPEKPGSHAWGELYPCVVTWVKLRPRAGGPTFCWFNTHFDVWSRRARVKSAELLLDRMREIAGSTPCIVTGDFNSAPNAAPYRTLLTAQQPPAASLHDAFRVACHRHAPRRHGPLLHRLDRRLAHGLDSGQLALRNPRCRDRSHSWSAWLSLGSLPGHSRAARSTLAGRCRARRAIRQKSARRRRRWSRVCRTEFAAGGGAAFL